MSAASPVSSGIVMVTFDGSRLSVEPQIIEIPVGGFVLWHARSAFERPIVVEIDFHTTPFGMLHLQQTIGPREASQVAAGPAQEPGQYKYDVKISTQAGEQLADDDPYIIVTRER